MKSRAIIAVCAGLATLTSAMAQEKTIKDQLIGLWTMTGFEQSTPDGKQIQPFGENPTGSVEYRPDGHFSVIFLNPDLPKLASNERVKPTSDEAMALAVGSLAYFGTYQVDEANKTITFNVEASSFRNMVGAPQKRVIKELTPNEMTYMNPAVIGGGTIVNTFKRTK